MKWATRLHLLTLLTWRAMRQNRSQSILGIALITLPVAVATFAQVTYSTAIPTDQEEKVAAMGMAQARVSAGSRQLAAADLKDVLPDGARILEASTTVVDLETGIGAVPVSVSLVDLSDATTRGMFDVTAGRIPTSSGQVVVSEHLADIRNVDINSRIRLSNGHMAIVTGKIRDPTDYGRDFLLGLPDDPEFNDGRGPFGPWLVSGLPSGYDEPELSRALAPHGFKVDPRSLGRTPGPRAPAQESSSDDDRAILLFAALGLGEVSLLSAAVFTLSAQRRRRELGMLASVRQGRWAATSDEVTALTGRSPTSVREVLAAS